MKIKPTTGVSAKTTAPELSLSSSEIRYRRLFEAAQDGILILEAKTGRICDVNPYLLNLLGASREEMLGKTVAEISPFQDMESNRMMLKRLQAQGYVRYDNLPLKTKAGGTVEVEFVCNSYQAGDTQVIQCNIRNITVRKEAERRREEYSQKLQVLSRRLVEVQEAERRHLARELHDEIGQSLTVAQLNLQAALQSPQVNGLAGRLRESLGAVEQVLEQIQDIALNLRPSILDDLGLKPALVWLASRQAELTGLIAKVHADSFERRLDTVVETGCFRIAQEALTNVARHARAKHVAVDLHLEAGQVHLCITDDGVGFEAASVRAKALHGASLGLLNMEERALLVGGHLAFNSVPGHGTQVHAWLPLRWQARPALKSA